MSSQEMLHSKFDFSKIFCQSILSDSDLCSNSFCQSGFAWIALKFFSAKSFTGLSCRSVAPAVFLFVFIRRRESRSFSF